MYVCIHCLWHDVWPNITWWMLFFYCYANLLHALLSFTSKGIDCSNGRQNLFSHSSSWGILILLLTGEGRCDFGKRCSTDGHERCEGNQEECQSPVLGEGHSKSSKESSHPLNEDGKFISNSSINFFNITAREQEKEKQRKKNMTEVTEPLTQVRENYDSNVSLTQAWVTYSESLLTSSPVGFSSNQAIFCRTRDL